MNAVPSPGHKKTKNFKLNQGITKNLNFYNLKILPSTLLAAVPRLHMQISAQKIDSTLDRVL